MYIFLFDTGNQSRKLTVPLNAAPGWKTDIKCNYAYPRLIVKPPTIRFNEEILNQKTAPSVHKVTEVETIIFCQKSIDCKTAEHY